MKALIAVTLKPDVLDPQGKAIQNASTSLGYDAVTSVRQGKLFEVNLDAKDEAAARAEKAKPFADLAVLMQKASTGDG